ncbi:MAG: cyclic nucleotide-binding domain-containing protein [Syntrophobacterales bacterium]
MWVYVIMEGEVKVSKNTSKGKVTVAKLGEGDFIGELEFLDLGKEPRSATVAAVGPVKLGVLDRDKLRREYDSLSPDFRKIIRTVVQRLRRITVQAASLATS